MLGEWCQAIALPSAPVDSSKGPMRLRIGSRVFSHVWINRNGFVFLGESGSSVPASFVGGVQELSAISGDIIAPFYAPIVLRPYLADGFCPIQCVWDLTYSHISERASSDSGDGEVDALGFRATWGLFPREPADTSGEQPLPGVTMVGGTDPQKRNNFQLWLIDREPQTGVSGDFDLHLNYSGITWQAAPTLIGVKTGPATTPEVLLDFAKFYRSPLEAHPNFLDDNPNVLPEMAVECASGAQSFVAGTPYFSKSWALGCNTITVEFRNGIPNLKTYTSDISVGLSVATGPLRATVPFGATLAIANGNLDRATNIVATVDLPQGATLSSTPASMCHQAGSIATCTVPELNAQAATNVPLVIRSNQSGAQPLAVRIDADQYDSDVSDNSAGVDLVLADAADLSIVSCSHPPSVTQGAVISLACTIRNDGPQAAANVSLVATVPANLSFRSGAGCSMAGATLTCSAPNLVSGATLTLTPSLDSVSVGAVGMSATVLSDTFDPVSANTVNVTFNVTASGGGAGGGGETSGGGGVFSLEFLLACLGMVLVRLRRKLRSTRSALSAPVCPDKC